MFYRILSSVRTWRRRLCQSWTARGQHMTALEWVMRAPIDSTVIFSCHTRCPLADVACSGHWREAIGRGAIASNCVDSDKYATGEVRLALLLHLTTSSSIISLYQEMRRIYCGWHDWKDIALHYTFHIPHFRLRRDFNSRLDVCNQSH